MGLLERSSFILPVLCFLSGCTTARSDVPTNHIIQFDRRGVAIDPSQKGLPPIEEYDKHLDEILNSLSEQQPTHRKVLIFIHGGLNSTDGSINRAVNYSRVLQNKGYFPIFINWESSLLRSYAAHLIHLRQGEYTSNWYAAPFVLASDLIRSIGRTPLVWSNTLKSEIEANRLAQSAIQREARNAFCEFRKVFEASPGDSLAISKGTSTPASWIETLRRVRYGALNLITLPTQLASAPVIDGAGGESWNVMLRNVELLFRKDCISREDCLSKGEGSGSEGGLAIFLDRLEREIANTPGVTWEITLIGHSMGTIVANKILRSTSIEFSNVVYIAAACSVDDYEQSVFPYLANLGRKSQIYHLILHDVTETKETSASVFFPRGSLLVWIDNFLSSPLTLRQRTAGRFVNLVRVLDDTPPEFRPQIHVKAFDNGGDGPQKHGDFLRMDRQTGGPRYPFYDEAFWTPLSSKEPDPCCEHPIPNDCK